jgi:hypothetical protein
MEIFSYWMFPKQTFKSNIPSISKCFPEPVWYLLHYAFFLAIFLQPEDGGDIFLESVR